MVEGGCRCGRFAAAGVPGEVFDALHEVAVFESFLEVATVLFATLDDRLGELDGLGVAVSIEVDGVAGVLVFDEVAGASYGAHNEEFI